MPTDHILEQMMTTIIDAQKLQAKDISDIKTSMAQMLVMEEKMVNQKEALSRMGSHVDTIDLRLCRQEKLLIELRIVSAKLVLKVSLIAAGASALVTTIGGFILSLSGRGF